MTEIDMEGITEIPNILDVERVTFVCPACNAENTQYVKNVPVEIQMEIKCWYCGGELSEALIKSISYDN